MHATADLIHATAPTANARHVEALLREEHGTLDAVAHDRLCREIRQIARTLHHYPAGLLDTLAESHGIDAVPSPR